MGFIDSIKGAFNPDIIDQFDDLYNNHYKALEMYIRGEYTFPLGLYYNSFNNHYSLSRNVPFSDKKSLVEQKNRIIDLYAQQLEYNKELSEKVKIISLSKTYPHAFTLLCKKYFNISFKLTTMPNERISQWQRKEEQKKKEESKRSISARIIPTYTVNNVSNLFGVKQIKDVLELEAKQISELLKHLSEFQSEQIKIVKELEDEQIKIDFEDKILDNDKRSKYCLQFLNSRGKSGYESIQDKGYCIRNISSLDLYIKEKIQTQYDSLKEKYPNGVKVYEEKFHQYNKEIIINDETLLQKYQVNYKETEFYNKWEESQKRIVQECRNLYDEYLPGWQCCKYNINFEKINIEGAKEKGQYTVWQSFSRRYSEEECIDYSLKELQKEWDNIQKLKDKTIYFTASVYDKIINYIIQIQNVEQNITVILEDSNLENGESLISFHFAYLQNELQKNDIRCLNAKNISSNNIKIFKCIVIVELISSNKGLKKVCENIINNHKELSPNITYISLEKGYDRGEIETLTALKKQEIIEQRKKEEAEQRHKEEEERKKKELILQKQREEEQAKLLVKTLRAHVSNWDRLYDELRYYSPYNYYPTTCDFDATQFEWGIRKMIWHFKYNPEKTNKCEHDYAMNRVISIISEILKKAFGYYLPKLTLVCIPASVEEINTLRYEAFSNAICESLGMINAYPYITIKKDRIPKHLGGTGDAELSFNSDFFKNKNVILFDDVITKGNSMINFTRIMESYGANVICGLSIGRTKHERCPNPIDLM